MSTAIYTTVITALLVLVPVIDQITKAIALSVTMDGGRAVELIPGVLQLHLVGNKGAAMGLWNDSAAGRVFFMVLSTVAIIGIAVALLGFRKKLGFSDFGAISLALVAGGGIGNMIDRTFFGKTLFQGEVIDFLDFCAFPKLWKWTFNVADVCICVGVGLFILSMIAGEVRAIRAKKAEKAADGAKIRSENDATDENSEN